jgi:hypothetical protein
MDANTELDGSAPRVQDPLRRAGTRHRKLTVTHSHIRPHWYNSPTAPTQKTGRPPGDRGPARAARTPHAASRQEPGCSASWSFLPAACRSAGRCYSSKRVPSESVAQQNRPYVASRMWSGPRLRSCSRLASSGVPELSPREWCTSMKLLLEARHRGVRRAG